MTRHLGLLVAAQVLVLLRLVTEVSACVLSQSESALARRTQGHSVIQSSRSGSRFMWRPGGSTGVGRLRENRDTPV
jgi:hypothetical protein